jgi:hypothetical protein
MTRWPCALLLFACNPESNPIPQRPFVVLIEGGELEDFPDQIDSPDVRLLSGQNGRAEGVIDVPGESVDIDVLQIAATPGKLLRFAIRPGSGISTALRPFLLVADGTGEILALRDGTDEREADLQVVAPTRAKLFVVIQDARNVKENANEGGAAFDYILTISQEDLSPSTITEAGSATLSPDGLRLFSLATTPGQNVSIIVSPTVLANPSFVPFLAVYTTSFDLGATVAADSPLETIQGEFTAFTDQILFGVSDFSGELGEDFTFDIFIDATP